MNDRIKELAKKAGFPEWTDKTIGFELETFAKLIIEECLDIMMKEINNTSLLVSYPPKNGGIWDAHNAIKKHFGVE